jgi:hypothetical protein
MTLERRLGMAKCLAISGFLILLTTTYWIRSEALALSRIRFSADEKRVELEQKRSRDTFADRQRQHEVAVKNYDLSMKHYEKMLEVYDKDLAAYAALSEKHVQPPQLPWRPAPPTPPEVEDQFRQIQTEFVLRRFHYFAVTEKANWICCLAALSLVGGLLFLLMFDTNGNRLFYFLTLMLSFVFLIGPSFHTLISAFIGLLHGPNGL